MEVQDSNAGYLGVEAAFLIAELPKGLPAKVLAHVGLCKVLWFKCCPYNFAFLTRLLPTPVPVSSHCVLSTLSRTRQGMGAHKPSSMSSAVREDTTATSVEQQNAHAKTDSDNV